MFDQASVQKVNPAEGPTPDLVWPQRLIDRHPSPLLVYLDLNHWIGLAQAACGHPSGARYQPILDTCREARANGGALFPLADAHYIEVSKIKSPEQRQDLAAVMEELSDFWALLDRPDVMRIELDVALASLLGDGLTLMPPLPLLGRGVFWAFGRVGLRIQDSDQDITHRFRSEQPDLFDQMFRLTERRILAGRRTTRLRPCGPGAGSPMSPFL